MSLSGGGAPLTFAARPLYVAHLSTTVSFGIGPLADQQLAGMIRWVPGMALCRRRMILVWAKRLHIAALILWCAGLVALPLVLSKHDAAEEQADCAPLRRITQYG